MVTKLGFYKSGEGSGIIQGLLQYGPTSFCISCNFCAIGNIQNWFNYHLNIFKKYQLSQNLEDIAQKFSPPCLFLFWICQGRGSSIFLARSFTFWSSERGRLIFLSYILQILGHFTFFEDVQMIVRSVLDIFNGTKVTRNPKACGSILEQSLAKTHATYYCSHLDLSKIGIFYHLWTSDLYTQK